MKIKRLKEKWILDLKKIKERISRDIHKVNLAQNEIIWMQSEFLLRDLLQARKVNLEFELDKTITAIIAEINLESVKNLLKNYTHSEIRDWEWEDKNFIPSNFNDVWGDIIKRRELNFKN